nr:thermonuclease family protein [Methylobacterium sp. Leaf87]
MIRDTPIRLHGRNAPESTQTCKDAAGKDYRCGQAAALALAAHIGKRVVTCDPQDTDRYGRVVAVCRAVSEDRNAWMVREWHAIADRCFSRGVRERRAHGEVSSACHLGEHVPCPVRLAAREAGWRRAFAARNAFGTVRGQRVQHRRQHLSRG